MTIVINNLETNRPASDLANATVVNSSFEAAAPDNVPGPFYADNYNKFNFVYDDFGFVNAGRGSTYQTANGYPTGIGGAPRYGIGAFYFFVPVPNPEIEPRRNEILCAEEETPGRTFWEYLSTFWNYLDTIDRESFEAFWYGLTQAGADLIKRAQRLLSTTAPENAWTCVLEDYYDVLIGPLHSKPIDLDPTIKSPNYIVRPIGAKLIEPLYDSGTNPIYRDVLRISATDYYKIREIGLGTYVVVQVKRENVSERYFKVYNILSSEEKYDRPAFAEVNETINFEDDPNVGRVGITAKDYTEDVSEYNVLVTTDDGSGTSVIWAVDSLHIKVDRTAGETIDQILAIVNTPPAAWAMVTNRSPKDLDNFPIIIETGVIPDDSIKFNDLPEYIYREENEGRYYPPEGKKWNWFDGYSASDGSVGDTAYGEWVDSFSNFNYIIEVEGDLSYIEDESFTIHFTTGRTYDILSHINALPSLQNFIDPKLGVPLYDGRDYRFYNNTVEFFNDLFTNGQAVPDTYLYCPKASAIEHILFELYGTVVNVPRWQDYNYTNISGKAGINSLLKSLQNSSNRQDYERALNVYYGLPVSPERSDVLGLYESYGYKVMGITNNDVTLEIPENEELHQFIQPGGRFLIEGKTEVKISIVPDRPNGIVTLEDASSVDINDIFYVKLNNRFFVKNFYAEDLSVPTPGYIDVYIPEGARAIQHVIDVLQTNTDDEQYPEILIYGTEGLDNNYNGVYHITNATEAGGVVRLTVYEKESVDNTVYNDYIGVTTESVRAGFAHFSWPTHKFLHIYLETQKYYKAYIDSPIDTIHDAGDVLNKYDIITRNVSVVDKTIFPGWVDFDHFRRFNGINLESDILEITYIVPGATFGKYFPSASVKLL